MIRRGLDTSSVFTGVLFAALVNGAILGLVLWLRARPTPPKVEQMTFVDAKLVRFGKPRDLSFLPHIQATAPKSRPKEALKLSQDPDRPLPRPPEDRKDPEVDPALPRLPVGPDNPDDRATSAAQEEGSLTGSRGGTAAEASGDPFIREVLAAIQERWTVPSLLTADDLARLSATACLTLDDEGKLVEFKLQVPSGNALFDGSLTATLGALPALPKPYGPFAAAARRGKLCPVFSK